MANDNLIFVYLFSFCAYLRVGPEARPPAGQFPSAGCQAASDRHSHGDRCQKPRFSSQLSADLVPRANNGHRLQRHALFAAALQSSLISDALHQAKPREWPRLHISLSAEPKGAATGQRGGCMPHITYTQRRPAQAMAFHYGGNMVSQQVGKLATQLGGWGNTMPIRRLLVRRALAYRLQAIRGRLRETCSILIGLKFGRF